VLTGHAHIVGGLDFSPDGARLLTTSADRTIRVWRVRDGAVLATYRFTSSVHDAAFSPDRTRMLVALDDGTARIFPLGVDDMLAAARCQVGRGLTAAELDRFAVGEPRMAPRGPCPPVFSWQK